MSKLSDFFIGRTIALLIVFFGVSFTHTSVEAQNKRNPLTNLNIIEMSKAKLDKRIILETIQTSETNFDISPPGLIQLKKGGVKPDIIEAMVRVERVKDNRIGTTKPIAIGTIPNQITLPTPTPIPSPTPKPPPVQTRDSQFFRFDLEKCNISGTTIVCFFTITNKFEDRKLALYHSYITLVDEFGNEKQAKYIKIGGDESYDVTHIMPQGYAIDAWIRFEEISPSIRKIVRLNINAGVYQMNSSGYNFQVLQFSEVPLQVSENPSSKPTNGAGTFDERIPETDAERRSREQKEAELKRKTQQQVQNILNKIIKP